MKTKKDILKWWENLGNIKENIDDLTDFRDNINKDTLSEYIETCKIFEDNKIMIETKLKSNKWKYPLYLYFIDSECIKISGF